MQLVTALEQPGLCASSHLTLNTNTNPQNRILTKRTAQIYQVGRCAPQSNPSDTEDFLTPSRKFYDSTKPTARLFRTEQRCDILKREGARPIRCDVGNQSPSVHGNLTLPIKCETVGAVHRCEGNSLNFEKERGRKKTAAKDEIALRTYLLAKHDTLSTFTCF